MLKASHLSKQSTYKRIKKISTEHVNKIIISEFGKIISDFKDSRYSKNIFLFKNYNG